jgi:hypothetical protein
LDQQLPNKGETTMTLLNVLRRRRLVAIAVLGSCAGIAALGIWRVGGSPVTNAAGNLAEKQKFQERIRQGVGSEVRFGTAKDSEDDIKASIESVARFIHSRSGMRMSEETKSDLLKAETETLRGERSRISIDALTDSLTATAAARVATLTENEIEGLASTFRSTPDGQITLRIAGNVGHVPRNEFVKGVAAARGSMQRGELESSIRPAFEFQVSDRATSLSEAMPEQFGRITAEGVTPAQAVLIAYSVASDDALADSQNELARRIAQERVNARLTRAEARAQRLNSPTQYGRNGFFYASPVQLVFNRGAVQGLLNLGEGGKGK